MTKGGCAKCGKYFESPLRTLTCDKCSGRINDKSTIKVFGDEAEPIKNGDRFTAVVDEVEGRKRVKLIPDPIDTLYTAIGKYVCEKCEEVPVLCKCKRKK